MSEVTDAQVVEEPGTDLVRAEHHDAGLWRTDDPVEVVAMASRVADALKSVVKSQGLITTISGREHPRVEAWQTLGSMLGVFPVKEWVREIPWPEVIPDALKSAHGKGLAFGYEASFRAQRPDGATVGGGEAECKRTENQWKARDDYALKSMAQTRATSKALKGPLGFVMSLAGYDSTPAEEMPASAPQQDALPFGPSYDIERGKEIGAACVRLANGDPQQGRTLWKLIAEDCGGYMPEAAARALLRAANTDNLVPDIEAPELS